MAAHASITGCLSSTRSQALLYDAAADGFRNKDTVLDSFAIFTQVASKEDRRCVPDKLHDDRADDYALAAGGCQRNCPAPCPATRPARLRASFQGERVGKGRTGSGKVRARDATINLCQPPTPTPPPPSCLGPPNIPLTKIAAHASITGWLSSTKTSPALRPVG